MRAPGPPVGAGFWRGLLVAFVATLWLVVVGDLVIILVVAAYRALT